MDPPPPPSPELNPRRREGLFRREGPHHAHLRWGDHRPRRVWRARGLSPHLLSHIEAKADPSFWEVGRPRRVAESFPPCRAHAGAGRRPDRRSDPRRAPARGHICRVVARAARTSRELVVSTREWRLYKPNPPTSKASGRPRPSFANGAALLKRFSGRLFFSAREPRVRGAPHRTLVRCRNPRPASRPPSFPRRPPRTKCHVSPRVRYRAVAPNRISVTRFLLHLAPPGASDR